MNECEAPEGQPARRSRSGTSQRGDAGATQCEERLTRPNQRNSIIRKLSILSTHSLSQESLVQSVLRKRCEREASSRLRTAATLDSEEYRRLRNRQSAKHARARKKEYMALLEKYLLETDSALAHADHLERALDQVLSELEPGEPHQSSPAHFTEPEAEASCPKRLSTTPLHRKSSHREPLGKSECVRAPREESSEASNSEDCLAQTRSNRLPCLGLDRRSEASNFVQGIAELIGETAVGTESVSLARSLNLNAREWLVTPESQESAATLECALLQEARGLSK